ncbi:hypothetical protein [Flavobacterium chryseum]|uniref:hypothetical protein n=1 Tax=Flavobacterium sp. P3160 TaxID=2512113 RepID=UPI00105C97DF|nr:hypothetical protein [Flavobacterium sp. P3160]
MPDKLEKLEFKRANSIGEFTYSLTKLIIENGYTIVYDVEEFHDSEIVNFHYSNFPYEWHWYIMESKSLLQIDSNELKIGYAQLMLRFGKNTEISFIDHNYTTFEDSLNEYETDCIQMFFEDGSIETDFEIFEDYEQAALKPFQELKAKYDYYVSLPLDNFYGYTPKNDKEKELKELIYDGLAIDFSIIHRFPDDQMAITEDEELVSYTQSFMLICEYVSELNELMMEGLNDRANNCGVTNPVNYHTYQEGKIVNGPSIEEEKELQKLCEFLCNLSNYFD